MKSKKTGGHGASGLFNSTAFLSLFVFVLQVATVQGVKADVAWGNTGTDFNLGANWVGSVAPATTDVAIFGGTPTTFQPSLTADTSVLGLSFGSSGNPSWTLGGTNILTLGTSGIESLGTGTQTINSNVSIGATQGWLNTGNSKGTLTINGVVSGGTSSTVLSLGSFASFAGPTSSTINLNAVNTYTGDTKITGGVTLNIGNDNALGTSNLRYVPNFGNSGAISASGGNRTLSNKWENGGIVTGSNNITFTGGSVNDGNSGGVQRNWEVRGSGKLILDGQIAGSVKKFTIQSGNNTGASTVQITGTTSNTGNNQNADDGIIVKGQGTGTLLLELNKTAGSNITGGNLIVSTGGTARWLNSDQLSNSRQLDLQGGTVQLNNFSETTGSMTLTANSILDFGSGSSSLTLANSSANAWSSFTLTISQYVLGSDTLRFGTNSTGLTSLQLANLRFADYGNVGGQIDASGFVTPFAVPEPSTYVLLGGGLGLLFALRRKTRKS